LAFGKKKISLGFFNILLSNEKLTLTLVMTLVMLRFHSRGEMMVDDIILI